jgi:hypothetical protein
MADTVVAEAKKISKYIEDWEKNIVESRIQNGQDVINWPSRINTEFFNIKGVADAADPKITQGTKVRLADLQAQWQTEKAKLTEIKKSIDNYNKLYKEKGLEAVQF